MKYPAINEATKQYWLSSDFFDLDKATKISDVFAVAVNVLNRMPEDVAQVCGPITSGGKGSIEANLLQLNSSIQELQKVGVYVFDQMPFEETFHRIVNGTEYTPKDGTILLDFYEPVFLLDKIKTFYFIPGWESSNGANWEYTKAQELNIGVKFL